MARDPALPEGRAQPGERRARPAQLARRLAQIGIVDAADGHRLQALLKTGQRLVSKEGALWRWDGFTASADAPTAAAQRLAQKNRLAELDAEMAVAAQKVRTAEAALAAAENTVRERVAGEGAARQAWRDASADASAKPAMRWRARRRRRANSPAGATSWRNRAPRIADDLAEAASGLHRGRNAACGCARSRRPQGPAGGACRRRSPRDRGVLADARALHDGLKREAEARIRRLAAIATDRGTWMQRAANAETADRFARRAPRGDCFRTGGAGRYARRDRRKAPRAASQLSEAETLRKAAADRLQEAENGQAALRQGGNRCDHRAVGSPRGTGPRRGTAERCRRTPQGSRSAHPGGAEHPAASGHPPGGAGRRRAAARHGRGGEAARPAEDRARAARRGQPARRGGAAASFPSGWRRSFRSART